MKHKYVLSLLTLAALILIAGSGCGSGGGTTQAPTQPPTQAQPTNPPPTDTPLPPTDTPVPPPAPTDTPEPTPTPDVEALIKSAKILLWNDTLFEGLWVKEALDKAGYSYTLPGGVGDLLGELQSTEKWDLIIIAAESRGGVSGEFWDILTEKVNNGTALIYETWTLDLQGLGKVKQLLTGCGVEWQTGLNNVVPIFYYVPDSEVFNKPNQIARLRTAPFWVGQNIDLVKLTEGSDAQILAGTDSKGTTSAGVITSCYGGRVILQTFSTHDYNKEDVLKLWQNYVHYTLKNYFK